MFELTPESCWPRRLPWGPGNRRKCTMPPV
jgi:hypothetical protein